LIFWGVYRGRSARVVVQTTKIDISFFRGGAAAREDASFVAFNPTATPGRLVAAASMATRQSISNQVACKLALDRFVDGVLALAAPGNGPEASRRLIEVGFKSANAAVYQFGHKLAAGGRMAAALLGLVVADGCVVAGRAGQGAAYLCRGDEVFPFFDQSRGEELSSEQLRERLVGAHSMVSVEFAEVRAEAGDIIVGVPESLTGGQAGRLRGVVGGLNLAGVNPAEELVQGLCGATEPVSFALVAAVGPRSIYLDRIVSNGA
jgi:hypothetical protein